MGNPVFPDLTTLTLFFYVSKIGSGFSLLQYLHIYLYSSGAFGIGRHIITLEM